MINFPNAPALNETFLAPNGITYTWDGVAWNSELAAGETGPAGPAGADGASAYDIAVANGFTGTEAEWLASLEGADGAPGDSAYQEWLNAGNTGTEADFLASLEGAPGADGANGLSAYEVWLAAGNTGTEQDYLDSLVGPEGPQGVEGPMGSQGIGIRFVGRAPTVGDLPATGNTQGDLWIVESEDPDAGYIWDETTETWVPSGPVQGPQGIQGLQGDPGLPGDSAYAVAVANGFVGTEAEWLASLQGADGAVGPAGPEGPTVVSADAGNTSIIGTDGKIYTPAPAPAPQMHYNSDTPPVGAVAGAQWFNTTNGRLYTYYQDADSLQWVSIL